MDFLIHLNEYLLKQLYKKLERKKGNDLVADVAQLKCSNNKYYN